MADIFLSYSRENRASVDLLADALVAAGYSVWWDRQLTAGGRYLDETTSALDAAKVVLVVWSKTSIASHWVADEAGVGRDTGRLLPISLDGSLPPLGFRQFQVIDFSRWNDGDEAAFKDLLSALARLAPPSGEAAARSHARKSVKNNGMLRRPVILVGAALAALALVAAIALVLPRSPSGPPANQRTAFFGFTTTSSDPVASAIASTATDETFKTLSQIGLDTVSRAETQNVKLGGQAAHAKELGARYTLGGEVRSEGGRISVSMRMDDAVSRATIWEETLTGDEADKASLPFQATAAATNILSCYTRFRASLKHEDDRSLKLLSRYCDAARQGEPLEVAERLRELAAAAPDSALVHGYFAGALYNIIARTAPTARPTLRTEMDAAVQRTLDLDPGNARVRALLALQAINDGKPFAESEKTLLALLRDNPNDVTANNGYGNFLAGVGRNREAPPYHRAANRLEPFNLVLRTNLTLALARTGQTLEAAQLFEETNTRLPTSNNWSNWMNAALFYGVGDPEHVLKSAPVMVSGDTLACWRDIATAKNSRDRQVRRVSMDRMRQCLASGNIIGPDGFQLFASFGELDAAFKEAENIDLTYSRLPRLNPLFALSARPVRADPRFVPLVKRTGQYRYWLDSGTHPDVCDTPEEQSFDLCVALRTAQAGK